MAIFATYGGNSHAHPSPPEAQHLNSRNDLDESSDDVSIHVELRGLPGAAGLEVADIYCPKARRWPFVKSDHVNRLDVISCWKGLSHQHAAEVALWTRLLGDTLEEQLEGVVRATFLDDDLSRTPGPKDGACTRRVRSLLAVDLWRLVHNMITLFYSTCLTTYGTHQATWFSSVRDLPGMIYNFVRTHDCFRDARPNVEADISYARVGDKLQVVADVLWQRPHVEFSHLAVTLRPGREYVITPEHVSIIGSTSGFPQFPEEIVFTVCSNDLQLVWDPETHCFRSVVPGDEIWRLGSTPPTEGNQATAYTADSREFLLDLYGTPYKPQAAETTFTAKTTLLFPGHVRHERISRYNIRLDIGDPRDIRQAVHPSVPCDVERFAMSVSSQAPALEDVTLRFRDKLSPEHKTTGRRLVFEKSSTFQNTRLALDQFEHVELEVNTKPQKLIDRIDSGLDNFADEVDDDEDTVQASWDAEHLSALVNSTTRCQGKALQNASPAVEAPSWAKKLDDHSGSTVTRNRSRAYKANFANSKVMPLRKRGSVKRMVFHRHKRVDSLHDYPTAEDSTSFFPPGSEQGLSQREIQSNYEEFMQRNHGGVSPRTLDPGGIRCDEDDKEQRKAIESAFLEDSQMEECTTETDASSIELEMSVPRDI